MASSSCVVTQSSPLAAPEMVMSELTRGREIADRLRLLLRQTEFDAPPDSLLPAHSLVAQILDTFSHSLSMLRDGADSDEVSQAPSSVVKSEDSGDSYKTPGAKDRRGCYKRKRNSDTIVKDTPNLLEDGHAWRKYGQKAILNAKHPRNYFRCTHKFDQGCQASKQVQKIEDDPPLYRTTYHGHHTCTSLFKSPHHIIIDATPVDSSILWSFDGRSRGPKPDVASLPVDSIKHEEDVQIKSLQSGRADYYISPDLTAFNVSTHKHVAAFSSGSDHGDVLSSDVYSCTASSIDDMDAMVGSIEEFFEFESLS